MLNSQVSGRQESEIGGEFQALKYPLAPGPPCLGVSYFFSFFACCFSSPKCPILIALQLEKIGDHPLRKIHGGILIGLTPALGLP